MTFENYLSHDDGIDNHYELVDGQLIRINPPRIEHFLISKLLEQQLDAEIQRIALPWMTFREVGIRAGYNRSRLADICVVMNEQAQNLMGESAVFQIPPRLFIEVVSPEAVMRDYRYKRSEYAVLEVPEYWVVDPLKTYSQLAIHLEQMGLTQSIQVEFLYLPSYSPKLNLVEYVIHLLRLRCLHHLPLGTTLTQIKQQLHEFFEVNQFLPAEQVQKTLNFIFSLVP